jgi:ribosomal protein S18 acetylase RimI-like enzyme
MTGSTRAAIEASEVCGQRQAAAEPSPKRHTTIELRPIDVVRDRELIIRYASDLFAISFGESRFKDQFGSDGQGYPAWIADKQAVDPTYAALALLSDVPVGMVVVGAWPDDHAIGYVYHYYLAPHVRGCGLATQLDHFAVSKLSDAGHSDARLSVAAANERAIRFYGKQGWAPAGPRPDQPGILYMRRCLNR